MDELVYPLDEMDGYEFEDAVANVFRRLGYRVDTTSRSADKGRDLVVHRGSETAVVQCKNQRASIGRPILQKLHSAAATYPNASKAIVVASGRFANTSREYMAEVNRLPGLDLELWDYEKLVAVGRPLRIYFTKRAEGTTLVFTPGWTSEDDAMRRIWDRHLSGLKLHPKPWNESIPTMDASRNIVPAVSVSYELDQRFATATYNLHHAYAKGHRLLPVAGETLLAAERKFWESCVLYHVEKSSVGGKPIATHFGVALNRFSEQVAREVAQANSKTVSYTGRNNQTYVKRCDVRPSDVRVNAKQVLLARKRIDLSIGPSKFNLHFADSREKPIFLVSTGGFEFGESGFVKGEGVVCNDCGMIAPSGGLAKGRTCDSCGKTLCANHRWRWPARFPRVWPILCSVCYKSRNPSRDHLQRSGRKQEKSLWPVYAVSPLPGVAFFVGRRYAHGLALLALFLSVLGAVMLQVTLPIVDVVLTHRATALVAAVAASSAILWGLRLSFHRRTIRRLQDYDPPWSPLPSSES